MRVLVVYSCVVLALVAGHTAAFRPLSRSFSSRSLIARKMTDNEKGEEKKGFSVSQLIQLITMGAGAPSLGEYKSTDENGKMFFELDANKFNGGVPSGKYVESGYVDEDNDEVKPPGFWMNLASGGKLQTEYENKIKK